MKPEEHIIDVADVSFAYGKHEVLSHVDLQVPRGDYVGIIGPNGAGKTTLLKIIMGLMPPTSGHVRLFGKEVHEFGDWEKIGYVPQKATNFDTNFPATVEEVVLMGRYALRGLFRGITADDREAVRKTLREVGMESHRKRLIGDLSGGEQQRVFVARALVSEPEVVFLDEPTIGVDAEAEREFYALLKRLNDEKKLTLVLISHDVETLVQEAKHVACINRVLVCNTRASDFLSDERWRSVFKRSANIMDHHH